MSGEPPKPDELDPSELGKKSFWDAAYTRELENFSSNTEDVGTIWFDDSDAEAKILEHITEELELSSDIDILDLGTGNGHLLAILREEGDFAGGRLVGVDYSAQSIALARNIMKAKELEDIEFAQWDIIQDAPGNWVGNGFDLLLDKGTFDAISLSEEKQGDERIFESYPPKIAALVRDQGFILITSCNWTEEEVVRWFAGEKTGLKVHSKIKYPSFEFGGQKGQTISSICFQKVSS